MVARIFDLFKTARPRQWVKNLTLYAGLIFTGNVASSLLWWSNFWMVTEAILAFTLVAISVYFLNDLVDIKGDQAHPFKKFRPVAMGRISKSTAMVVFLAAGAVGLGWAQVPISPFFPDCFRVLGAADFIFASTEKHGSGRCVCYRFGFLCGCWRERL